MFRQHYFIIMLSSKFLIMCLGTYHTFFSVTKFCFGSTFILLCLHRSKQYCSKASILQYVLKKEISGNQVACLIPVQLIYGKMFWGPATTASFQTQIWICRKYPFFICYKILFRRHYFIFVLSSKVLIMCFVTYPTFLSVTKYYFGITSILTMGALWLASFQKSLSKAHFSGKYFFMHNRWGRDVQISSSNLVEWKLNWKLVLNFNNHSIMIISDHQSLLRSQFDFVCCYLRQLKSNFKASNYS